MPGNLQKEGTPLDKEVDVPRNLRRHGILSAVFMELVKCLISMSVMVA